MNEKKIWEILFSRAEGLFQLFHIYFLNYRSKGKLLDALHAGIGNGFIPSVFSFKSCYSHGLFISGCKYDDFPLCLQVLVNKFYSLLIQHFGGKSGVCIR